MLRPNWIVTAATALLLASAAAPAWSDHHESPPEPANCEKACDAALDSCTRECQSTGSLELCPQECEDDLQKCNEKCEKESD